MGNGLYNGLYTVTQCRQERGNYGKLVYKFVLHRLAGQPEVNGAHVGMPKKSKKSKVLKLPSVVADDVSQGKEEKPVRAVNTVDDEKLPPFHYVTNVIYPEWYESTHSVPRGCDCINGCLGFEKCPCTVAYGGDIPFTSKDDIPFTSKDAIVRRKPLVYECGPSCKCLPSCQNRVSQNGIRYHLEIFMTEKMGWGVRSRDFIRSGGFVCEYTGELLREQEAEERVGNDEYLFDIGKNGSGFTIDAAKFGNVGRFINHSCSPNLYAQNVLYDHDDKRMPHIMFFASKSIPPLRELTYDYNYKVDGVRDGNGDIKRKDCYCGSRSCSGRLYCGRICLVLFKGAWLGSRFSAASSFFESRFWFRAWPFVSVIGVGVLRVCSFWPCLWGFGWHLTFLWARFSCDFLSMCPRSM
ncbi:histone-lysine N-methyltransferase, H3 lysine-9 specific SUVH5-like [Rhododendron vialii]|uniref:histone-lysine N-methyltransferase, H3 lysine-9 specific SUVH5-like n=1 Tax=Rhododendron vialii TaxID=182163 RepID=UPI00265DC4D4|nr:histone-lysine N-methyltransferase, H3 lysine-9 specific SUVH5-like [Rhododendron vialii]